VSGRHGGNGFRPGLWAPIAFFGKTKRRNAFPVFFRFWSKTEKKPRPSEKIEIGEDGEISMKIKFSDEKGKIFKKQIF
jgi:hypothetical protein